MVADFMSAKEKPRGGVYYEAGFARWAEHPRSYDLPD
jgi:hypothetical protein